MPTPPEHEIPTERVIYEDTAETFDTAVVPLPVALPPPPPAGYPVNEQVVVEDVGGPRYVTTASGERVLVDDPGATRVVTRDVRPPLPPDEDPRRWNWLTPALFILLVALGIVLAAIVLSRNNDNKNKNTTTPARTNTVTTTVQSTTPAQPASASIQVPSVVGQTRADAESSLDGAGLAVDVATVPGPPPTGQVLAQSPAAGGTLKSGDHVRINVSDGQSTAGSAATSRTSTTGAATATPASPTTTASGSSANSSSGRSSTPQPTPVSVPALSGDVKTAVQSLVGKGLLTTINYVPSDEPLGTVVSQSPSEGTSSHTGTHITLSVSSGPGDKEQETVPDTSGQTIKQAVGTLNAAGLRLILVKKTVADKEEAGKVVEQTPASGAQAPKNAQVLVYMGAFKG
jgi:serine/threonine-protein kinase